MEECTSTYPNDNDCLVISVGMWNRNGKKNIFFCQKISQGAIFMTEKPGLYLSMHYCFEGL